jgi:hypothetical protein
LYDGLKIAICKYRYALAKRLALEISRDKNPMDLARQAECLAGPEGMAA